MFLVILNTNYCEAENATQVYYGLSNAKFVLRPAHWFLYQFCTRKLGRILAKMHNKSQEKVIELLRRSSISI